MQALIDDRDEFSRESNLTQQKQKFFLTSSHRKSITEEILFHFEKIFFRI